MRLQDNLYAFFPLAGAAGVLLIGLGLWKRVGWGRPLKALVIIYVLFVLTASPVLEPPGKQWGPRYMFLMLPLIALGRGTGLAEDRGLWARLGPAGRGGGPGLGPGGRGEPQPGAGARPPWSGTTPSGFCPPWSLSGAGRRRSWPSRTSISPRSWPRPLRAGPGSHTREPGELLLLARALQDRGIGLLPVPLPGRGEAAPGVLL